MPAKYIKNKLDKWWSRVLFRLISKSTHATRITLKLQPAEKIDQSLKGMVAHNV